MRILAALLLALTACGGAAARPAAAPATSNESSGAAEDSARDVVGEIYQSLENGDTQGILPLLGDPAFVAGASPAASNIFTDRTAAVVALTDAFGKVRKHKVKSRALAVHASLGGHSAWAIDKVDVDKVPYVGAAVLSGNDELWVVDAAALARPVEKAADVMAAAPLPVTPSPGTEPLVARFRDALTGRTAAAGQLDDDAVLIAGSGSVVDGAEAIEKLWQPPAAKKPKHKKKHKHHHGDDADDDDTADAEPPPTPTSFAIQGTPRAGLTPDGVLGWVCADVLVDEHGAPAEPRRFFYVYEKHKAGWRLVALAENAFVAGE